MYKISKTALLAVASLIFSQGAFSDSIEFSVADITPQPGSQIQLQVIGTAFGSNADAGDFGATWDPSVLSYVSTVVDNPPWDTSFLFETDVATGELNSVFLGSSANAGINFNVAILTFNVIGAPGSTAIIQLTDGSGSGWFAPGAIEYPSVTYNAANVTVAPVPAAVWLFGSALGFLGVSRRFLGKEIDKVIG